MVELRRSRSGQLKRNRRNELFRHQQHAYVHYAEGHCTGLDISCGPLEIPCPICRQLTPLDRLSEDHAPQKNGLSKIFGQHWSVVLTCIDCNETAGKRYEGDAVNILRGTLPTEGLHECPVYGVLPATVTDGVASFSPERVLRSADLKTALLLGFAVLGYTWVLSEAVRPVADAVLAGQPLDGRFGSIGYFTRTTPDLERTVVIGGAPAPLVHISGPGDRGAILPFFQPRDLTKKPESPGPVHFFAWPETAGGHAEVASSMHDGRLFILDNPDLAATIIADLFPAAHQQRTG